ncbi:LCP family protein, partial [Kitasatospora sp. LaBMicrA B282]|uniref:LCP family protein n=1 Tax=Kitasatospora sp. LaBMicrA B282 TaxID=3420949 RepID=UPI003D0A2114
MPADPQPDEEFEADLARAFDEAAHEVRSVADPLVVGGLARGRARRRRRRIATITGSCVALAVLAGGGLAANVLSGPQPVASSQALTVADRSTPPPPHLDKGMNILLIGLATAKAPDGSAPPDSFVRDQLHAGSEAVEGLDRTDTLLVLHFPADGGPASGLSVPRDVWAQSAGLDGRAYPVGSVYAVAEAATTAKLKGQGPTADQVAERGREAGRAATIATVQQLLGVPIDHFAEFDLAGFYDIAKAIGPIDVCVTHATQDRASGADLKQGLNTLDPAQALAFVRQRHGVDDGSDLARTRRQQAFIASALHTLRDQGVFDELSKAQKLFAAVGGDLVADQGWNPLDLLQHGGGLLDGRATLRTLPVGQATVEQDGVQTGMGYHVDPAVVRGVAQSVLSDAGASATSATSAPGSGAAGGAHGGAASP